MAQYRYSGSLSLFPYASSNFYVNPGSSYDLQFYISLTPEFYANPYPEGPSVHSFSFSIAAQPYVSLTQWTLNLPTGWESSFTDTSGSAVNISGTDLSNSAVLGNAVATVASDAPIGRSLGSPYPTNVSFIEANGLENIDVMSVLPLYHPIVVAPIPEPSTYAYTAISILFIVIMVIFQRIVKFLQT